MVGGEVVYFCDEDFFYFFLEKVIQFMVQEKGQFFFLYYVFYDIYVFCIVYFWFEGKSKMGFRGDVIL